MNDKSSLSAVKAKNTILTNKKMVFDSSSNRPNPIKINPIQDNKDVKKVTLPVLKLNCASCAARVEKHLNSQKGVLSASVNYASAKAHIEYLPKIISTNDIQKSIQAIGYDVIIKKEESDAFEKNEKGKYLQLKRKTIGAIILALPVFIIGMFFMNIPYANVIMWILSTPVLIWFGKDFFINAWIQARHLSANMDTLVALSTGVAYLYSVFNTLFPQFWQAQHLHSHVYFEAVAVIIAFILLGKLLEEKAKAKSTSAIKKLIGLQAQSVTIIDIHGVEKNIGIEEVKKDDVILVKPGEKISVDGVVISGESYVNESMLSGEAIPVLKKNNDKVYAGTINQKGFIQFRAEKIGKDTLLAQIIQMVQDAQGSKAPVQKLVDKIAGVFVPVVIIISMIAFVSWFLWGGNNGFTYGLLALVSVLVIACPCALGLATPTAIIVGIGKAAENGILIKDAESLEISKKIDTIVFDKTGTITEGKPILTDIEWLNNDDSAKQILYSIEKKSEHPLAEAVVTYYKNCTSVDLTNFESITGMGAKSVVEAKFYLVGNKRLMLENNILIDEALLRKSTEWSKDSKTVIWFSDNEKTLAIMSFADNIKSTSIEAIQEIKKLGIDIYMLTGDNEETAKNIAHKTGINHYKAEVLPHHKAQFVKDLQAKGKTVAMVGDGINDSSALAQAEVSIAMGKGSDIAMDVATMTLIASDLKMIPLAIKISKQTVKVIRQNLFWAFIYNIIGIPIAAGLLYPINGFMLNPMIAGAAMALSSVSVVSNSLRLKWIK